jgi:DNA-directed RNA polymerase specialized sigma24 family protein
MPSDSKAPARAAVLAAQKRYEAEVETTREAFAKAQEDGLSLREIAEVVGLHHTRVLQIIRSE